MDGAGLRTVGRWTPEPGIGLGRALKRGARRLRLALTTRVRWSEPTTAALAAVLGLSACFVLFPGVDLAVSDLFHRTGEGFFLSQDPALKLLRRSSTGVMAMILLAAVAGLALPLLSRGEGRTASMRRCGFLLAGLALGPGLVVNTVLKGAWGRARPIQTDVFGGEAAFSPAWAVSDACARNCSFVSGEAASAAWMVAAVLVLPRAWRRWAVGPMAIYAVALSLNRLAFGGHHLSDILLSWALTALVLACLHRMMVTCPGAAARARAPRRRSIQPAV